MKKQIVNPYLPGWEYIPDGEPHLFDGRVYIYGSHDEAGGSNYCTGDYVCWSAPENDMTAWSFEGVIYHLLDEPEAKEGMSLAAPDVAKGPDGRYYLYYFIYDIRKLAVAVCDTPAGHYRYLNEVLLPDGIPLSKSTGYSMGFDPGILSDESGNWLYYGFGVPVRNVLFEEDVYAGGYAVRLNDDMYTMADTPVRTIPGKLYADKTEFSAHPFFEASSIRHYGDLYYFVYSSLQGHELCYATSRYPDRDFNYRGVIISNGDIGMESDREEDAVYYLGNNHGGLLRLSDGRDYIFYHRHTHGTQYSRQGCAEEIIIEKDGDISQVEITSCGLNGGPLRAKEEYSAHIACCLRSEQGILHYSSRVKWNEDHPYIAQESGISPAATLQNQYIFNLRDGAVCGFKYFLFDGTEKTFGIQVRGTLVGRYELYLDTPEGISAAAVQVDASDNWTWRKCPVTVKPGVHALYLRTVGVGAGDLNAFFFR